MGSVTTDRHAQHHETALLRRCLMGLSAAIVVGIALDLAMERHWGTTVQLIPWFTLAVIGLTIAALAFRQTALTVRVVRVVTAIAALSAAYGTYEHVAENVNAGPLDLRYADRWDSMSTLSQWWAGLTKAVGPSPTLAPGALLVAVVCLCLATLRHPALAHVVGQNNGPVRLPKRRSPDRSDRVGSRQQ